MGGVNTYGYVGGNPVGFVDPDGLTPQAPKGHVSNQTPSNLPKHQKGDARRQRDAAGEKGDKNRRAPRKKPNGWKGKWPKLLSPFYLIPNVILEIGPIRCGSDAFYDYEVKRCVSLPSC